MSELDEILEHADKPFSMSNQPVPGFYSADYVDKARTELASLRAKNEELLALLKESDKRMRERLGFCLYCDWEEEGKHHADCRLAKALRGE